MRDSISSRTSSFVQTPSSCFPIIQKKAISEGATPHMHERIAYQGITFDDVLLEPAYSDVVPKDVDVRTQL